MTRDLPANTDDTESLALFLHDVMQQMDTREMGIVLCSCDYFTRRLTLNIDERDNLREVLELQSISQFPDSYQELSFDAVQVSANSYLMFALPGSRLQFFQNLAQKADAKLAFISPGDWDILRLLRQQKAETESCLLLTSDHEQIHLDLIENGVPTHVSRHPIPMHDSTVFRACKRAMLSATTEVQRVFCDDAAYSKELERLNVPVQRVSRPLSIEQPETDFLHSRTFLQDRRSHRGWWLGLAAGLLVLVALGWTHISQVNAQQRQVTELEARKQQLLNQLADAENVLETDQAIASWQAQYPDWFRQLENIAAQIPSCELVYLDSLSFMAGNNDSPATMQLSGRAKSVEQVIDLNQKIAALNGVDLEPAGIREGMQNETYPHVFNLDLAIQNSEARNE